jgi:diguanylate cyclase (GGDEF)-like protein
VAEISIPHLDRALTVSIGMAAVPDHAGDAVTLFRAADRALYAAKRNGRNRVETATFEDAAADEDLDLDLPASSAD